MVCFRSTLIACLLFAFATNAIRLLDKKDDEQVGNDDFAAFVVKYGRQYKEGTQEYNDRRSTYLKNAAEVDRLNSQQEQWTAALNHLSDWSDFEMKSLLGYKSVGTASPNGNMESFMEHINTIAYPTEQTWAHLESIKTAVDQGACGSCWAVTTSRLLAAHSEIFMGSGYRNFSTQEIVDCTPNPKSCGGKGGCDGATVTLGLDFVMRSDNSFIKDYPYTGVTGKCKPQRVTALASAASKMTNAQILDEGVKTLKNGKYDTSSRGSSFGMTGWGRLPINKETPLVAALQNGPVGVSVDGSPWSFYSSGVFTNCNKDAIINHAVLAIGYGTHAMASKYWLIQNSWGAAWGDKGTIKLIRHAGASNSPDTGEETHCGIDHKPEEGSGCIGGPKSIEVCGTCGILVESAIPYFGSNSAPSSSSGSTLFESEAVAVAVVSSTSSRGRTEVMAAAGTV